MKTKPTWIIFISTCLLIGCKKDNIEDGIGAPPNVIFEVRIGDNYFKKIEGGGYIFLSKSDGSLIDYKPIANNDTVYFSNEDTTLSNFTVTIATNRLHVLADSSGIQLHSFINVPIGSVWRLDKVISNSVPKENSANVLIKNTGEITYSPYEVWGNNSMGRVTDNSNGNLSLKLFSDLPTSILAIYQSKIDYKIRYLYRDEIMLGETDTFEQNSLPIIETPITVDVGQAQFDGLNILGYPIGGSIRPFGLSRLTNVTGITEHYFPSEFFNRFLYNGHGWLSNDTRFYIKKTTSTFESVFNIPDYDYEVVENDGGFVLTPTAAFDYATVCYRRENGFVTWCAIVNAESNISFKFPEIPAEILSDYEELSSKLFFSDSYGYKYTPSVSYLEFLERQFRLDSSIISEVKDERLDIVSKKQ